MERQKIRDVIRQNYLPALVLLMIAVFFILCKSRLQTEFPEVRPLDGILDVRDVDFSSGVWHVVNEWDYYPGQLYAPEDFAVPETVPVKHNESPLDAHLGTWRIRILARENTYLSLCSFSIDYSTRIFVNGEEVRNIGYVSADPKEAVPMVRYVTLPLYSGETGEIEIIYQYANFVHHDAGFIQNTLLSTPENIDEYQRGLTLNSLLVSSGHVFLLFYFLLCAALQKNREYAALALCCLVIALRNQYFFSEYLLGNASSFYIKYRIVVLDVSLIPASAFYLLAAFYPNAVKRNIVCLFTGIFAVLGLLHFLVPTQALVTLCHVCYYVCAPFLTGLIIRFVRYFRKEQKPNRLDVLTLLSISFFIVMLVWEGIHTGSDSTVNHFGVTPLAMVFCILLLAIVINSRIQYQTAMLRQVRAQNILLGQMYDMNQDFLRTIAHELKTPLTVISGYAQLIERQMESGCLSEKTPDRLRTIYSEADRLGDLVTRLIDYSYGRTHDAEMRRVDIEELFRSTAAIMMPVCARRQNALTFRNTCSGVLHGNFELLLQLLINLIVNATRHTEAGQILVEAKEEESFIVFTVSDTGSGIAAEDVPYIFEKGFTTGQGRGLGLAICRDIVSVHSGQLELVSTSPRGTIFRFTVLKWEGVNE